MTWQVIKETKYDTRFLFDITHVFDLLSSRNSLINK